MTNLAYGDYSRVARMAELRFIGVSSELLLLPPPVDFHVRRPGMACFYHIKQGSLRFFPDSASGQHYDLGPGHSVGIEDGRDHRWQSFEPTQCRERNGVHTRPVELFTGYVDRRHTVIQRLLGAVIVVPPDAAPQASIISHCVEAMIIELGCSQPNDKVVRRLSEIVQLEMLDYADQRLAGIGPIPPEIRRDAPLLRAWTAFLGNPAHNWTVAKLAEVAGISRTSLFERFRRVLNKSPIGAMRDIRIHYAAEMLRTSQAPVSEIAAKVGYGSDVALLRAFRQQMGTTPASWRARTK